MVKTLYCIRHGLALHNVLFWEIGTDAYTKYNDTRLLEALMDRKGLSGLKYLANVPTINLKTQSNKIDGKTELAIPSSYMPKVFKKNNQYKSYN